MPSLIKDGVVYRTFEEQVQHLTEKHIEQLVVNKNLTEDIKKLLVETGYGGYNLVRFAFEKKGIYYKLKFKKYNSQLAGNIGDYVEISSNNTDDIPAYGYYTSENEVTIDYLGDFVANYNTLYVRNVTKGTVIDINVELEEFEGSGLLDYDPNQYKRQVFNVIDDLAYNERTQYVSFDLNNDEIYNFVFIGANKSGKDGNNWLVTNGVDTEDVVNESKIGDLIVFTENNDSGIVNPNAVIGDVYKVVSGDNIKEFQYVGNIRGAEGKKGQDGTNGINGINGRPGVDGEKGEPGTPKHMYRITFSQVVINNVEIGMGVYDRFNIIGGFDFFSNVKFNDNNGIISNWESFMSFMKELTSDPVYSRQLFTTTGLRGAIQFRDIKEFKNIEISFFNDKTESFPKYDMYFTAYNELLNDAVYGSFFFDEEQVNDAFRIEWSCLF